MPTEIQWADETFNPWWGCEKVSPACAHCYAEGESTRRGFPSLWGADHGLRLFADGHWAEPERWDRRSQRQGRVKYGGTEGERIRVFTASMADVFEERDDLVEPRERLFALIEATPHLDWLVLTKRPEFARDWMRARLERPCNCMIPWLEGAGQHSPGCDVFKDRPPLPNVWMGVSIENARWTWRADVLREIPAAVRFISAEPLLGSLLPSQLPTSRPVPVDLSSPTPGLALNVRRLPLDLAGIDWVIAGGESGPKSRPSRAEWFFELKEACAAAGTAFFVKQLGKRLAAERGYSHPKGGDWAEWVDFDELHVREFPAIAAPPGTQMPFAVA